MWVPDLVFRINAIDDKKWVKFVAMQHKNIFLEVTAARFVDNKKRKEDGNFYATMKSFYSLNTIMLFLHTFLFWPEINPELIM